MTMLTETERYERYAAYRQLLALEPLPFPVWRQERSRVLKGSGDYPNPQYAADAAGFWLDRLAPIDLRARC